MISFLKSFFVLLSQIIKIFEKVKDQNEAILDNKIKTKARAYDKLQKSIEARRRINSFDDNAKLMSDDGYKRKQ